MARGFHPYRHLCEKFLQHDVLIDADDGVVGASHSRVGLIGGPVGQDAGIGGGDVGVGPDHGGNAAVEIPSHRDLFAGHFGVEIDESNGDVRRQFGKQRVCLSERAIGGRHVDAALKIQNRDVDTVARGHDNHAAAGEFLDVVCRAQQARLAREVIVDFAFIPDVVAGGDDVDAVAEQILGKLGRDAETAGGVFAIGDREVDIFGGDDFLEVPRDEIPADGAENVTDKKKIGQVKSAFSKERTTGPS